MMDRPLISDNELLDEYARGDASSFRALVERYHDPLLHFLLRLTGNRQTAEDVFQETFLQVHQSLDRFDRERAFKPWLFTIAANKARDSLRKNQRRGAVSIDSRPGGEDAPAVIDLLSVDLPGPGLELEAREQSELVQAAIDEMPPRLREILLLAYFQRMSYAQLAEAIDIPIGTVKSRLHAAVASFASRWQEQVRARKLRPNARTEGSLHGARTRPGAAS